MDRATLIERLDPIAARLHRVLEGGCACTDAKVAAFCANLLGIAPALWRFVVTEGIEPTNNHAERLLRRGVLWRKNAFGCHSAEGYRFVERILTVSATCRKQQRHLLTFVTEAIAAYWAGRPAPTLLSTPLTAPQ